MSRPILTFLVAGMLACAQQSSPGPSATPDRPPPTGVAPQGSAHRAPAGRMDPGAPAQNAAGTQPGVPGNHAPAGNALSGAPEVPEVPEVQPAPVERPLRYPTRVAVASDGTIYVTDALAGAVFVFNAQMQRLADIGGLGRPLGIAVDGARVLVGDAATHQVKVYRRDGTFLGAIDDVMDMPNALALDGGGRLYVADSRSNTVQVYNRDGHRVVTIRGAGGGNALLFPSCLVVGHASVGGPAPELFVGDQGHGQVVVYGLDGTFHRVLGQRADAFGGPREGRFVRIQGLALDGVGNLHVADAYLGEVQVLDALTGVYVRRYRPDHPSAMPLDVALTPRGDLVFTDGVNTALALIPASRVAGEVSP